MAIRHGKDGVVKQGSNTIAAVTSWKFGAKAAAADSSAMGDSWESHVVGLNSADGSVDCHLNPSDTAQEALTIGASVTLNLYPQGTTTGLKYWTFTATITSLDLNGALSDNSKRSFGFKVNGTPSWSTA